MSILNVEHLSHGFGDRTIFTDVSFRLLKGEHIGLIGANGEGKSTFMNIITGKLQPDEGKIEWAKERIQELDRIKEKEVDGHNEFLKEEREKTNKNITGGMLLLAVSAGLISNKQVRQMGGKAISSVGKGLLRLKK